MPGTATRSPETLCHRYRLPSLPLCLVMLHLQRANALHNAQSSLNWAPVTQRFLLTYPALPDFHNYATRFHSVTFRNLALGSKCCLSVCDSYHTDVLGLLHFCTGMTSGVKKKIWNSSMVSPQISSVPSSIQHKHSWLHGHHRGSRECTWNEALFFSRLSTRSQVPLSRRVWRTMCIPVRLFEKWNDVRAGTMW